MNASSDWYRSARVRAGEQPGRLDPSAGAWFARALRPHVAHPLVQRQGPEAEAELLRFALIDYLRATDVLELKVVHAVSAEIAMGGWAFAASHAARIEARMVTCDEGFHALWAGELLAQAGDDPRPARAPAFLTRLGALQGAFARSYDEGRFIRFLFTVVTETAITPTLVQLAKSPGVDPAVAAFAGEHAKDEARHARFFTALFAAAWPTRNPGERARYSELLPKLVDAYLAPDLVGLVADLQHVGLTASEAAQVAGESRDAADDRRAARPVLACFRRAGAVLHTEGH